LPEIKFKFILVDPASKKKKYSDFSVFWVIGVTAERNYFVLDMIRDKLNLTERWAALSSLVEKHDIRYAGYEEYSMQSDIEYIREKQFNDGLYFEIIKLGGTLSKHDKITRLVPLFEEHRIFLPENLIYVDREGKTRDLTNEFIYDEFLIFPSPRHDDMLDSLSRIEDHKIQAIIPRAKARTKLDERPVVNLWEDDIDYRYPLGYMSV
jgi:predicted phage terminase large subunit-like protein